MSTTHILNVITSAVTQMDIPFFTRTNLVPVGTRTVEKGGIERFYKLSTSDDSRQMGVRMGYYPDAQKGTSRHVCQITTWLREESDSEDLILFEGEVKATLSVDLPIVQGLGSTTDFQALLCNLFTLTFETFSSEVPTTGVISNWKIGNPSVFNDGH